MDQAQLLCFVGRDQQPEGGCAGCACPCTHHAIEKASEALRAQGEEHRFWTSCHCWHFHPMHTCGKHTVNLSDKPRRKSKLAKFALAVGSAVALSGCAGLVPWVAAHKAELAAVGIVAGTVSAVGGALVQVDEVEQRLERRLETDEK